MEKIIGLGGMAFSNRPGDILKTFALGTCVGVTAYSERKKAAGMIHIVLPRPDNGAEGRERPAYYATTGIPLLIHEMCRQFGCRRTEIMIGLFGGAELASSRDVFRVGQRNIAEIEKILVSLHLSCRLTDTGGCFSRTIELDVHSGEVKIDRQPLLLMT